MRNRLGLAVAGGSAIVAGIASLQTLDDLANANGGNNPIGYIKSLFTQVSSGIKQASGK